MTGSPKKESFSNTVWLPSDLTELFKGLTLILQEIQAANNSNKIIEELFAIAIKLLEYKCISTNHRFLANKGAKTPL